MNHVTKSLNPFFLPSGTLVKTDHFNYDGTHGIFCSQAN